MEFCHVKTEEDEIKGGVLLFDTNKRVFLTVKEYKELEEWISGIVADELEKENECSNEGA